MTDKHTPQTEQNIEPWITDHEFVDMDNFGEPLCTNCGKAKILHYQRKVKLPTVESVSDIKENTDE